jgi:hypothetical protein
MHRCSRLRSSVHDADRLAPQACCPAMARLPSKRQRHDALVVSAQPRVTGRTQFARCGDGAQLRQEAGYWSRWPGLQDYSFTPPAGPVGAGVIVAS